MTQLSKLNWDWLIIDLICYLLLIFSDLINNSHLFVDDLLILVILLIFLFQLIVCELFVHGKCVKSLLTQVSKQAIF